MGEVYRARDSRLGREVAIKLLLDEVSADRERLERFEREARVLASLNHPNVATLHGFESDEDSGSSFLVMELVEGPTLADRIAASALSPEEAIPVFIQIAEGLEAAHDKGVVHRDLKPANIKISEASTSSARQVKILDFGLAKALDNEFNTDDPAATHSPTLTLAATQRGEILGTAAYMSPEQAQGEPADERADIWAFGICLLEALTGRRVFDGDNVSLILASVPKDTPDLSSLPATSPPAIRRLLRRCLVKSPRDRLPHIGAARLELLDALNDPRHDEPRFTTTPPMNKRTVGWATAATIVAIISSALAIGNLRDSERRGAPRSAKRFTINLPDSDRLRGNLGQTLAFDPDGSTFFYSSLRNNDRMLFRRALNEFEPTPVSGTEGAWHPMFSPDGEWMAFLAREEQHLALRKVRTGGGPSQTLARFESTGGFDWGEDGWIVGSRGSELFRLSATGGDTVPLLTAEGSDVLVGPEWLPGGDAVLYTKIIDPFTETNQFDLFVVDLETKEQRLVLNDARAGTLLGSGILVFARDNALWATRVDPTTLEVLGPAVLVVDGISSSVGGAPQFALSSDGALAYLPRLDESVSRRLLWVDRRGQSTPIPAPARDYRSFSLSPDSRLAAAAIAQENNADDLWIVDLERGTFTRLTSTPDREKMPVWSPDGQHVVYTSDRSGEAELLWRTADGSGQAEELLDLSAASEMFGQPTIDLYPTGWSPDARSVVVTIRLQSGRQTVGRVSLDRPGIYEPLFGTLGDISVSDADVSADGKWLAYQSTATDSPEIFARRLGASGGALAVTVGGAYDPRWVIGGSELVYIRAPHGQLDTMMSVKVHRAAANSGTLEIGDPEALFGWSYFAIPGLLFWDVTPDGERFLVATPEGSTLEAGFQRRIHVVIDWESEVLERLALTESP